MSSQEEFYEQLAKLEVEAKTPNSKMKLIITKEFKEAFNFVNDTNNSCFITGKAGSGKSTFIRYLYQKCRKKKILLATTGVAAVNITDDVIKAQTVHSFFHFPPMPLTYNNLPKINEDYRLKMNSFETIIIDESSMLRVDIVFAIDQVLRIATGQDIPFGGKQIVFVGDLAQLPPVIGSPAEKEMILHQWESEFFFHETVIKDINLKVIEFIQIFRQKDELFISILNRLRSGDQTQEDVKIINNTCYGKPINYADTITLCTTNANAKNINDKQMSLIEGKEIVFNGWLSGKFNDKNCPVERVITLKVNCRVMVRVNFRELNVYNGSTGIFLGTEEGTNEEGEEEEYMRIKLDTGKEILLARHEFKSVEYTYNKEKKHIIPEVIGTFKQYPVILATATTIHKSQGMTLERVNIDMGRGAFASGQVYVALSRCKTLEGITLLQPIYSRDCFINEHVKRFLRNELPSN